MPTGSLPQFWLRPLMTSAGSVIICHPSLHSNHYHLKACLSLSACFMKQCHTMGIIQHGFWVGLLQNKLWAVILCVLCYAWYRLWCRVVSNAHCNFLRLSLFFSAHFCQNLFLPRDPRPFATIHPLYCHSGGNRSDSRTRAGSKKSFLCLLHSQHFHVWYQPK